MPIGLPIFLLVFYTNLLFLTPIIPPPNFPRYASAVLADTKLPSKPRSVLFGWVFDAYDLPNAVGGASFDSALSLPRVMGTRRLASGAVVPTWDIAPEIAALRVNPDAPTLVTNMTVPPTTAVPVRLPDGAHGDAVEVRLNFSHDQPGGAAGPIGLSVRATNGSESPSEQTLVSVDTTATALSLSLVPSLARALDPT
jgi:hypothetical protein